MLRRWRQRHPVLVTLAVVVLFTSVIWLPIGLLFGYVTYVKYWVWTEEDRAHKGEGLPSDARKWRAALEDIPSLDDAEKNHPELVASPQFVQKRFPNGEWLFGVGIDSHGPVPWHRGGTVVLKDSRGRIRVFYGHVCGPGAVGHSYASQYGKNLDDFYSILLSGDAYTEQFLTP